jgi:DNA polymerase zeta
MCISHKNNILTVQCGRTTLEWVITEVESNPTRDAKVVYGDTDSVFVHLKGRTKADAFRIGAEIAHEITRKSPVDVLLKMEKVYLPSVLVSKKRYVGNAFEDPSPHSTEVAHFDAKGIEVVRRDQCGATVKIQEKALRLLFETKDLSIVKEYLYKQVSAMNRE